MKGFIFDIQPFSVYDGPGIRTTVFLKGCNLRCKWCHNPESWETMPQLTFYPDKCINCSACFHVCHKSAHVRSGKGHEILRDKCKLCGDCAEVCYANALEMSGYEMDSEKLFDRILSDKGYFDNSGGGVTFSGGEPLLQSEFLNELLIKCREAEIHTAIDTAGLVPYQTFDKLLENVNLVLYDIKAYDEKLHEQLTGVSNQIILENLKKLIEKNINVLVRIPCIKGANLEDMDNIAHYLSRIGCQNIELLAYHRLGESKMEALGRGAVKYEVPSSEEMLEIKRKFTKNKITVIDREEVLEND